MAAYPGAGIEVKARRTVRAVVLSSVVGIGAMAYLLWGTNDAVARLLVTVFCGLLLIAGCYWIGWFADVYDSVIAAGRARHGRAMVVAGWLIPGFSVVASKRLVEDVWHAPDEPDMRTPAPVSVRLWWLLWATAAALSLQEMVPLPYGARVVVTTVAVAAHFAATPFAVRTVRVLTARVAQLRAAPVTA